MHITATCPFCATNYQVQPTLRGQPIRCPNPVCRKVFTVANDLRVAEDSRSHPGSTTPPPGNGQQSGSVEDMLTILPAEEVAPVDTGVASSQHVGDVLPLVPAEPAAAEAAPTENDWWQAAPAVRQPPSPASPPPPAEPEPPAEKAPDWWNAPPPVRTPATKSEPPAAEPAPPPRRRRPATEDPNPRTTKPIRERPPAATQPMPALASDTADQPRELPPGQWEPPPVRRGGEAAAEPEALPADHAPRPTKKRRAWVLIALVLFVSFGIVGGVGWLLYQAVQKTEDVRFAEARAEYEQGKYSSAASQFGDLAQRFPTSEHAAEYRFLQEWASRCSRVSDPDNDPAHAAEDLEQFVKEHNKDPLMERFAHDAGQLLLRLTRTFAERNASPTNDEPLKIAGRFDDVRRSVRALGPEALTRAEDQQIDAALGQVRTAVARWRERQELLASLVARAGEGPMEAIERVRHLLDEKDRTQPGIRQDAAVQAALTRLYEAHQASVLYEPHAEQPPAAAAESHDAAPTVLFAPLVRSLSPGGASRNDPIVLALARGVLYALKQTSGELKWAMRVGIDTTVLPERVPASVASPELILVLSVDTKTARGHATDGKLTALDTDGNALWEYHVGEAVLGRPVVMGQRAYLAAYDGWVHEIELSQGRLIGRYRLGQRLTCGGVREGDSDRLYFPADDSCIYVLDVAEHRCTAILYDGHPSGSLRSEPLVIPSAGQGAPGYLILNQRSGLDAMRLRVYELPLTDRHAAALTLTPEPRLAGWTWFEPYQDGEKLVALSDAGMLGLFGIRQPGNRDQALFPLLQPGGLDLSPFLHTAPGRARERGRSEVVHIQGDDLWVLAYGRLQKVQLRWNDALGRQAVPGWEEPRVLGSPLHAPQRIEDHAGHSTFFLVTQPLEQQTCLATAITDANRLLWQRQLGLVCQGEPLALTPPREGPPLLLVLDQGGGLFVLDPTRAEQPRTCWQTLAAPLDDNPQVPPRLLRGPDGHSAYEIAVPGEGKRMLLRHVEWADDARSLKVTQREVALAAAAGGTTAVPLGTPAVVGAYLVVPMSEGYLARLALAEESASFESGPDWRSRQASPRAPGHLLALGDERFLVTDGARGLAVWDWPRGKPYQPLPEGRDVLTLSLPRLIAAPPLLLPAKTGERPRVLVGDSAGVLHLLTVAADGALHAQRTWDLRGKFTGAPFVSVSGNGEVRVGCVLDQLRLVWLDPERAEPLWTYGSEGAALVGQPQRVEDVLVVAHQSGHYVALDPADGTAKGPGYTLRASAAPAATPVAFGAQHLFTPLSDGTALVLPLEHLRRPKAKQPR